MTIKRDMLGIYQIANKYKSKCHGAEVTIYCPDESKTTLTKLVCVFVCLECGNKCTVVLKNIDTLDSIKEV